MQQVINVGTIEEVDQIGNSPSGNPRFAVWLNGGRVFKTAPDSQVGNVIANSEFRGGIVQLVMDARGEIVGICTVDGKYSSGRLRA